MSKKRLLIIGGTGKMGGWLAKFFKDKGFEVLISGRSLQKTRDTAEKLGVGYAYPYVEAVKEADMVAVSTPIQATPKIVLEVAPHLKKEAILFDLASIKKDVLPALEKAQTYNIHALSLHPMFGPGAKTVKNKNILVIPVTRKTEVLDVVLKPFLLDGAKIVFVEDAETHDKTVALTLALPHFLNMVFGGVLASTGIEIEKIKSFGGSTFRFQLMLTEEVFQEDPKLYAEIQTNNKYFPQILEKLVRQVEELKKTVLEGKIEEFTDFFSRIREFLAKDKEFGEAYKRLYRVLE